MYTKTMRVETIIKLKFFILILLNFEIIGYDFAEYSGKSPDDAKDYLDNSQGRKGFKRYNLAHPRNHCAVKNPDSNTPCVQNYSQGCKKSGFLTQSDQDFVAHHVLLHPRVQSELNILNQVNTKSGKSSYNIRRSITLSATELNISGRFMVGEWFNGVRKRVSSMQSATIVLQHFDGQETDPNAPVQILTFYPRLSEESESNENESKNLNIDTTIFTMRNLIIACIFCVSVGAMVYCKNSTNGNKFSQVLINRISDVDDGDELKLIENENCDDDEPGACAMRRPGESEESKSNEIQRENLNFDTTIFTMRNLKKIARSVTIWTLVTFLVNTRGML